MNKILVQKKVYELPIKTPQSHNYGIGVFYNSSESRALEYRSLLSSKSISVAILVDFDGGTNADKKNNLLENKSALDMIASRTELLSFEDIFDYHNNLNKIASSIINCISEVDRRSVFIDITGAPLIYSVALTKFLFRLFPVPEISLLNVSGHYALRGEEQFSEGEQYDMFIPGFYGNPDHSLPQHYVFLLGYDGERSLNIYRENLPEKISVIVPSPGYEEGNDTNTISNNKEFFMETGFILKGDTLPRNYSRNRTIYYIDVSDITAVEEQVQKIYDEDKDHYEIRLVPLGPKPHAIGAALSAVFNNDISIIYQVPRKYYMSEIPAGNMMWVYDLQLEG